MSDTAIARPRSTVGEIAQRVPPAVRLALKILLVGAVCSLSTKLGFALKFPPHYISPLWPTGAILFSVLVVSPVRHWWAYTLAAYFTSVLTDVRAGFPASAMLFIAAGLGEILIAAIGVRRFANGVRAFESLRSLVNYIVVAVVLAPLLSAFVAAFAGVAEDYWFYWRVWFLSDALAYLTVAPAILACIGSVRTAGRKVSLARVAEAGLIAGGLLVVSISVFFWPTGSEASVAALVYLPLPFLLWAAVRFGPAGVTACLLFVALASISAAVQGHGPFTASTTADNVIFLQLYLFAVSLPLMFLAALIAERRERTKVLRESEARFRSMADTAPVLIWMSGPDQLCTFFNQTWLHFTGRVLLKELGNGWSQGIHPDDAERRLSVYAGAFDSRREFSVEYRLRRHDGEYRWIMDKGVPRLAPDGMLLGYIGCAEDISERKAAEHDAQRRRQEVDDALAFERLVAGVLAALLTSDPSDEDRVIVQGLQDIARHLGVEGAALWERLPDGAAFRITHRWLAEDVPSPPDQLGVPELPWTTARLLSGAVVRFSRYSDLPDEASPDLVVLGRLGTRALLAVPFSISGSVAGVLSFASAHEGGGWPEGVLSRVTILAEVFAGVHARRAAERRERAAQTETAQLRERLAHLVRVHTMGEMSAAIAHEINQPLMAITNYTQAARRRLDDDPIDRERISDLLSKVAGQSARAGSVVKRIGAMVKRQEPEVRTLDLGRLIANAVALVEQELQLHDVRVELRVAPDLPPVRADEIQLQQVLLNLIRNAMDAMEAVPASADRTFSIDATLNGDREVEVRVRDRGAGIDAADAERVFDPFYSTKASGLGIGLAICRKIVEAHGGRLWLASPGGPGDTEFQFTLPAADAGEAA